MNRVTREDLTEDDILDNDVFVFGSNESGIHGAGAAAFAEASCGAVRGLGFGYSKNSFAIPTKDWKISQLDINTIEHYIKRFVAFVKGINPKFNPDVRFIVTKIGCGLAGYTPKDIAPFFADLRDNPMVWLPQEFIDIIDAENLITQPLN